MELQLHHKLHPRTGFMIIVPGAILLSLFVLLALSPQRGKASGYELLAAAAAVNYVAVVVAIWSGLGHVVAWDNDAVHIRQPGGLPILRDKQFQAVPYDQIRGIKLHAPPRGVPPKYPLIEIEDARDERQFPLFIDPNYFTKSSLATFIEELRKRVPALSTEKDSRTVDRLLKMFGR